jgi:hypothetical protein
MFVTAYLKTVCLVLFAISFEVGLSDPPASIFRKSRPTHHFLSTHLSLILIIGAKQEQLSISKIMLRRRYFITPIRVLYLPDGCKLLPLTFHIKTRTRRRECICCTIAVATYTLWSHRHAAVAVAIITKSISKGSIFAFTIKSWAAFIAKMKFLYHYPWEFFFLLFLYEQ